jgi:uracil phosphoribosyltransferase
MKKVILFSLIALSAFADLAIDRLVYQIRDPQTGAADFRNALEKIGEYLADDVLYELETKECTVTTLTGAEATADLVCEKPVLVTILRAGLPLNYGLQKVFSDSEVGFIGMARNEETLKADINYIALPEMEGRTVIISDTMLATGGSFLDAIKIVEAYKPKKIICVAAIASEPGIARIEAYNPDIEVITAAVDPILNDVGYIVPGLGDAGDRAYGNKHHVLD